MARYAGLLLAPAEGFGFRPGQKKSAIPLVLPIEEISLRPELSSPARFIIPGGSPERDTGVAAGVVVAGHYFSFLIWGGPLSVTQE